MKQLLFSFLALCSCQLLPAQNSGQRIKENAKWKTENKVNEKVDKAIDDVLDGKLFKKKNKAAADSAKTSSATPNTNAAKNEPGMQEKQPLKAYSKFDFIPGEKILYYDDFERVAVGDFPAEYNTDASGEVMTIEGKTGKWLGLNANGSFLPESIGVLPDNFTLEMNVGLLGDPSNNMSGFGFNFNTEKENLLKYRFISGSFVMLHPGAGSAYMSVSQAEGEDLTNEFKMPQWSVEGERFARVSLWRQKGRLRVYVNENKLMDIPRFFNAAKPYQLSFFRDFFNDCNLLITDIKFAVGAPDTRSKLITEGRFSTTGILFDFQNASLKPESYGVIKEIATALKENPSVNIKIVGHTSNDGDANANLLLSKQRAAAVKEALMKEFGIDASRMQTDGKGGTEPADKTGTAAGKANNRRVEFIKL
ncbi:MAG: OmpA family protein [Chitinophagaceae bacterium]|nr:OmpA family protein [Chitinophagaceae bacterium]